MPLNGLPGAIEAGRKLNWWRLRYYFLAALFLNIFLINYLFFGQSLNPFSSSISSVSSVPPEELTPASQTVSVETVLPVHESTVALAQPTPSPTPIFNLHTWDFDGEYIGWPLARVCDEAEFQPGLVFLCDNNSGGLGNIRNFILTCLRYAIEAGATEIIIPRIQQRSSTDLADLFTGGFYEFEYFFDREHFIRTLSQTCPHIRLHNQTSDVPNADRMLAITEFYPKELNQANAMADTDGCDGRGVNRHLDMFRTRFDAWLKKDHRIPTVDEPISIRFKWATFFEWPVQRDGPEFAATFGDILRIREDIRDLATTTLLAMANFVDPAQDPPQPGTPFLGIHLRTESDALGFWPTFDEQSDGYLEQGRSRGLKHAYIACGDAKEAQRFKDKAMNQTQLRVATKLDLLTEDGLERLSRFSWDQQALVDYLVLTKSAHFTGCSFSSFTMNIAFKRHLMTRGLMSLQWRSPGDAYSTLIGRFASWFGDWMFMYECMWP